MLYNLLLRQVVVVRCQTLHSMKQVRLVFLPGAVYGAGYPDGSDAGLFVGRGCMQPAVSLCARFPIPAASGAFSSSSSAWGVLLCLYPSNE